MVSNTVHATYTETYDLNTVNGELSILAIHTPQSNTLKRLFHGYYEQYKKMKVLGCNFRLVCPTKQELTPLDVGVATAGKIDPRDVMNPILFKAVTGEGINVLCDQIYNASEAASTGSNLGSSVDQHTSTSSAALNAYYALLADDSWRREHPQRGITVMGLKPMVHKVVTTQPFKWSVTSGYQGRDIPSIDAASIAAGSSSQGARGFGGQSGSTNADNDPVNPTVFVSNGVTEMPWLDTAFSSVHTFANSDGSTAGTTKAYALQTNIPRVYMGCLILPPSADDSGVNLFYRMQIVWHILFRDFRPCQDLLPLSVSAPYDTNETGLQGQDLGGSSQITGYFNLYHTASKLEKDYGSFDTSGVEDVSVIGEKVA